MGYEYYPLSVGKTMVYEVDSILYDPILPGGRDTFHWEIKETILEKDTDLSGRTVYVFERVERRKGELAWRNPLRGERLIDGSRAELWWKNLRFIPLTFPPKAGQSWEGGQYISSEQNIDFYSNWQPTITQVGASWQQGGLSFDKTLTVQQVNDEDLLAYRYAEEVFAYGVGMIQRTQYNLRFEGSSIPVAPWEQKATHGFIVFWRIKSF